MALTKRVYALSAVGAGYDLIRALGSSGVDFAGIIALSDKADRTSAAGFTAASSLTDLPSTRVIEVDDYSLRSAADRERIEQEEIDILLVVGWQRLVPSWLIDHCTCGVVGLHGSANGISAGRGRSPQNWAILLGAPSFELAAFLIDPGVDSGAVLSARRFAYTEHDDIASSYMKTVLVSADMLKDIVADWDGAIASASAQDDAEALYLPQRLPEDGGIDWNQPMATVRAQVAALTRPYPGACCDSPTGRIKVWSARPIGDLPLTASSAPGQVMMSTVAGALVVRAGDGFVAVDDFTVEAGERPAAGDILRSVPLSETLSAVVARHAARFPDQRLSSDLLGRAGIQP